MGAVNLDPLLEQLAELVAEKVANRLNGNGAPNVGGESNGEPMLTAEAVAKRLDTSARWVYDHADELGGKRLSRRCLRFPEGAIRRYVERRR
ncbi:MAG: hypothetical protein DMD44_13920 [Gemmatimonadetes bacterium]|nr:MAG: hypothetical protein DMD44_13920 [Gemmatimonadota bacterium]